MDPYLRDVLDACIRVLHVVAGIAWIGASFYFVRLDLALRRPRKPEDEEAGVAGEFWGVHGGGLYHSQKYRLAPAEMPEPLHWFKWEAYTTWLSGFALLVLLYYLDSDIRLVDPGVADLATWQAVSLSVLGIVLAWVVYDGLCRVLEERSDAALVVTGTALIALAAWGAGQLFAARAAYLQVGVMLGTVMVANVFFVIIPAHRKLVAAMEDGREPDPAPLRRAKARSVHNNYLTLPVLFTMLAGHFAFTYGASEAWVVLLAIIVLTAFLRAFFNRWHAGRRVWWIPAAATVGVVALALWLRPDDTSPTTPGQISFAEVESVIAQRCATCHSGTTAPLGVRFETRDEIEGRIRDIERMAVQTEAMPPGNATGMTADERSLLATWIAQNG
ncbi:MAG TPA: urate hydroxylase PuuD [Gaiellaceae bacterium]|nr:urate hydroxylase PuuD [Gaiellaceae bacterium]